MKLVILLFSILVSGCVVMERSVSDQPPYSAYIGEKFQTEETFFLTERGDQRVVLGERSDYSPKWSAPTFQEYESGEWENKRSGRQYLCVLPVGTVFELCDITYENHPEAGPWINWYARIVDQGTRVGNLPVSLFVIHEEGELRIQGMQRIGK
jgi:hypothetical protein